MQRMSTEQHICWSIGADHQQSGTLLTLRQIRQQLQGRDITPLQVFEKQDHRESQSPTPRWLQRIPVTFVGDCWPGPDVVAFPVRLPRSPPRAGRARGARSGVGWLPPGRRLGHDTTAATLAERAGRLLRVHTARYSVRARCVRAPCLRLRKKALNQRCLADAGLARDESDMSLALLHAFVPRLQLPQFVLSPDKVRGQSPDVSCQWLCAD